MLGVGLELYAKRGATSAAQSATPSPQNTGKSQPRPGPEAAPPGDAVTDKQLGAISGICRRKNISRERLGALIEQRTGKHQLRELTRRQASALLSELSNLNGVHA